MPEQKTKIEAVIDAFEDLALFTKDHWRATIMTVLLLVFMGATALAGFWVYKQIDLLNESALRVEEIVEDANPSPEKMQELLEMTNKQNILIDKVLEDDILSVSGERAYLIRFHNGSRDINGTHFMFMSTSNEITKDGISNELDHFQNVPTSMIPTWWITDLLNGKCVVRDPAEMTTETTRRLLLSMGISRLKVCPIIDIDNGNLLGVVGTSWVTYLPEAEECAASDNAMRSANAKLSAILSLEK